MQEAAMLALQKEISRRPCIQILDKIYSKYDCSAFAQQLYDIEVKLFNDYYTDQQSFKDDLRKIPECTKDYIDQISLTKSKNSTVEECCQLPIYNSIQLRHDSLLYTVNISTCIDLHYSLLESAKSNKVKVPISRLFVRGKSNLLLKAKESVNGVLVVFFNTQIEHIEGSNELHRINSTVLIVHPLGDLQPSTMPDIQGWIKVKLIKSKSIDTVISNRIATKLFNGDPEVVYKLSTKPSTKLKYARENEIRQHFVRTIMSSNYSKFEYYHCVSQDRISTKNTTIIKDYTPLQYSIDLVKIPESEPSQSKPVPTSHWKKLEEYSKEKGCLTLQRREYDSLMQKPADAQGYFKQVFFVESDVIQIFQKSTSFQRVTEIACLLKLRHKKHIGQIKQVIIDDFNLEAIGLTMERYDMTLKEYLKLNNHRRLTNYQRMDIIIQMLKSLKVVHEDGIAHRDLSTVNFMINICKNQVPLDDGSTKIYLHLIDFGKSIFFHPADAKYWWVNANEQDIYPDETKASTPEELIIWCKNLPYVMARPDHGYKFYRSIQTLPRSSKDHDYLPHLINPFAEDIYSLGTLIWKIFSGVEPWPGTFDTDFKKLREAVSSDYKIDHILDREVSGDVSKILLRKFLRVDPEDRQPVAQILDWMLQPHILEALLREWDTPEPNNVFGSTSRYKPTTQLPIINDENKLKKIKGRPKGALNKRTVLKIRMHELGKLHANGGDTNNDEPSEPISRKPRGRPIGSFKRKGPNEEKGPKRPVGRPRKYPRPEGRQDGTLLVFDQN